MKRIDISQFKDIETWVSTVQYTPDYSRYLVTYNEVLDEYRIWKRTSTAIPALTEGETDYISPEADNGKLYYKPVGGGSGSGSGGHIITEDEVVLPQRSKLMFRGKYFDISDDSVGDTTIVDLYDPTPDAPGILPSNLQMFMFVEVEEGINTDGNGGIDKWLNKALFDRSLFPYSADTKPLYVNNVVGDRPAVRFNNHAFVTPAPIQVTQYTLYYVMRFNGTPQHGKHMLWKESDNPPTGNSFVYADSTYKMWTNGNVFDSTYAPLQQKFHVMTARVGAGTGGVLTNSFRINDDEGISGGHVDAGGNNIFQIGFGDIHEGVEDAGFNTANMDVAFILGVHGAPSVSQDKAIMDYIKYHYSDYLNLEAGDPNTGTTGGLTSSGIRWKVAPGAPLLGTPTSTTQPFTELEGSIYNNGLTVVIPQQSMSIPFATTGRKRRDVEVADYLNATPRYEIIQGVEVDKTFLAPSPSVPANKLLVRYWDITDGAVDGDTGSGYVFTPIPANYNGASNPQFTSQHQFNLWILDNTYTK